MRTNGDRVTAKPEADARGRTREDSLQRALEREFPVICFAWTAPPSPAATPTPRRSAAVWSVSRPWASTSPS